MFREKVFFRGTVLGMMIASSCLVFAVSADEKKPATVAAPKPAPKPTPPASDTGMEPPQDPVLVTGTNLKPRRSRAVSDLSPEFQDSAFDRYVDLTVLGAAWEQLDAQLLTDVALQLAEGERVLLRNHKSGLTAAHVLRQAARVAANSKETMAIERLSKSNTLIGNDAQRAEITNLLKLAATTRSPGATLSVAVGSAHPTEYALYHQLHHEIQAARMRHDSKTLDELEAFWKGLDGIPQERHAFFLKLLGSARSETTNSEPPADQVVVASLERLAGESRVTRDDLDREKARREAEERRMEQLRRASENSAVKNVRKAYEIWRDSPVRPTLQNGRPAVQFNFSTSF